MKTFLFAILLFTCTDCLAQKKSYRDRIRAYQQEYVDAHEVVKGDDRKHMHFYPVNEKYKVTASFEKVIDSTGFIMKTSGKKSKKYFTYGILRFTINNKLLKLRIYQSEQLMQEEEYKKHLFVPFTDLTSGNRSYGGGRYLDFVIDDIKGNTLLIDFNKAYNPYCAYTTGYNCPIPPRENDLPVAIPAGEMDYGKPH